MASFTILLLQKSHDNDDVPQEPIKVAVSKPPSRLPDTTTDKSVLAAHKQTEKVRLTDLNIAYNLFIGQLKSYTLEFKGIFKNQKKENKDIIMKGLIDIVKPYDTENMNVKYLFMSAVSTILFKDFDRPYYTDKNLDECIDIHAITIELYGIKYRDFEDDAAKGDLLACNNFNVWHSNMKTNIRNGFSVCSQINEILSQLNHVTLLQLLQFIYRLHLAFHAFHPRPSLIIRQPGSPFIFVQHEVTIQKQKIITLCQHVSIFYKEHDELSLDRTHVVNFMLVPGLHIEDTIFHAPIATAPKKL